MSRTFFCGRKFWLRNAAAPNYHQDFKFKYMRTVGFGHLRVGLAAALGGAALFLAAPASDYIVGQNIVADGGYTLR